MTEAAGPQVERVLLIHDYAGARGGAEVVVHDLRAALRERGIDARLMSSDADPAEGADPPDFVFRGSTGDWRAVREVLNPDAVRVTRRALRTFSPQIIQLGMFLTQASPAILPLLRQVPTVWYPNEYRAICPKGTRFLPAQPLCPHPVGRACLREGCFRPHGLAPRLLQLRLLRRWRQHIDLVLSPSHAFARHLEAHGVRVDAVLPHPVAIPGEASVGAIPGRIGFAGRLVPEKGVDLLLNAMTGVAAANPGARLVVLGDGPEGERLRRLSSTLGLDAVVEFAGHVTREEVHRRLASAAVQVVPSLWEEPYGLVTVEAMARGTPVVATAVGAATELVEHGRTGFLVRPGDPAALAEGLLRVLADPALQASVREAARGAAQERHAIGPVASRLLHLYRGLLHPVRA